MYSRLLFTLLVVVLLRSAPVFAADTAKPKLERPNIILILTDDQGYGELGCHGNPILKTPNLDRLHAESVRFTAFHVSPTCAPTRAALMTGRHEFRSGVTHTIQERERLALDATLLPQFLAQAGYQTGIFGKWHLGDERPYRPAQRGFKESLIHGAGGIGQKYEGSCADFPNNGYFDPVLLHNERVEQSRGYCTDVFFQHATRWIEANRDQPFFAYIATNAPHGPFVCPPEYSKPYRDAGLNERPAAYYGMIANIDENVGRLLKRLDDLELRKKTLVIFMTDNGHTQRNLYNAGMRGQKNSPYEGGTRAAAFFSWPGTLPQGVDVDALSAHLDVLPTLTELAGVSLPAQEPVEGRSLVPLLLNAKAAWPTRSLFVHIGRWESGQAAKSKYEQCAVRSGNYRLVNNVELYDIKADPAEETNIADKHPEVVKDLQGQYDTWWKSIQTGLINENVSPPKSAPYHELFEAAKKPLPALSNH